MKIIITGCTGFIGSHVLRLASVDPAITSIVTLSRRPLPLNLSSLPKVTSIIHENFSEYPKALLDKLKGAEGCIWMIGTARPTSDPRPVDIGYTLAFSRAVTSYLSPYIPDNRSFRFIYTSGAASSREQTAPLWFNAVGRRSRGAAETALLNFSKKNELEGKFDSFVLRPGLVMSREWMAVSWEFSIPIEWLGKAMLEIVKGGGGHGEKRVWENRDLAEMGRRVVKESVVGG